MVGRLLSSAALGMMLYSIVAVAYEYLRRPWEVVASMRLKKLLGAMLYLLGIVLALVYVWI